jgi:hypothetical protein
MSRGALDQIFGPLIPPQSFRAGQSGYQPWEDRYSPYSLSMLSSITAAPLRQVMNDTAAGWKIGEVLTNDTLIIWLVDAGGQIWFALEELVMNDQPAGVPKLQTIGLTARADKLGHPSLVGCASARIGGEIFFDSTRAPPGWIINNKSGRYGVHPSRTLAHLKNVAGQFAGFGISLTTHFIG